MTKWTFLKKKHHTSTDNSIVNVSYQKNNIEKTPTVIDNDHTNSNIPSDNIIIPSSELLLPPYKPNKYYSFDNDPIERKITLKIFSENNKESRNLTLHKIKWKSFHDVKKYVMKFNNEYTIDRQSIKYMGEEISNNNTTFDELNCKIKINLDIFIEELYLQPNIDDKIKIDNKFQVKSSLIGKKGVNKENNDIVFIKVFSNYGNKIMAHAENKHLNR